MIYTILAIKILLCGMVVSLFVKNEYKLKISSIITLLAGGTICSPAINTLITGGNFVDTYKLLDFSIPITINHLKAIFIILITILALMNIISQCLCHKKQSSNLINTNISSVFQMLILAFAYITIIVHNGLFFLIAWAILSLLIYGFIKSNKNIPDIQGLSSKYLINNQVAMLLIAVSLLMASAISTSVDFVEYTKVFASNKALISIIATPIILGFIIWGNFVSLKNSFVKKISALPIHVSGYVSNLMLLISFYGILSFISLTNAPTTTFSVTALIITLVISFFGIIKFLCQKKFESFVVNNISLNNYMIFIGLSLGLIGLSFGNTLLACFSLSACIFQIINNVITRKSLFLLLQNNECNNKITLINLASACGVPFTAGFISYFLIYIGIIMSFPCPNFKLTMLLILSFICTFLIGLCLALNFNKCLKDNKFENSIPSKFFTLTLPNALMVLIIGVFPLAVEKVILCPVSLFTGIESTLAIINTVMQPLKVFNIILWVILIPVIIFLILRNVINSKKTSCK